MKEEQKIKRDNAGSEIQIEFLEEMTDPENVYIVATWVPVNLWPET